MSQRIRNKGIRNKGIKNNSIRNKSVIAIAIGLSSVTYTAHANLNMSTPYDDGSTVTNKIHSVEPTLRSLRNTVYSNLPVEHVSIVMVSEMMATPYAKQVLQQARVMSLQERRIVRGSCWDYLNEVFATAGVERETVFKGSFSKGPYVNSATLRGGDWLYFVNHSYHDGEHSGLFIGWVDKAQNRALILSYAGQNRRQPARYSVYDLSHVYQIMRPVV